MSRRERTLRRRTTSRRPESKRKSWWIASAIVIVPLLVIAFGAGWLKWVTFQYEYAIDLCLKNRPLSGHTVLVIDATDTLDQDKTDYLDKLVERIKRELKPFAKFSIFSVDKKHGGFPRLVFSLCNPGTAATTNIFMQAPSHVQRKFDEQFARPLSKVTTDLKEVGDSASSPLLETIQTVSELRDFSADIPDRHLILFSDMLQNSRKLSHYAPNWVKNGARITSTLQADLTGVNVAVHYLIRRPDLQTAEHRDFWREFFTRRGATFGILTTN